MGNTKGKTYTAAPLPFMGQKRNFVKNFKEVIKDYPDNTTYVDLFGGSGLLSHTVKAMYPNATVIYNDYDNYRQRLQNINNTNALMNSIKPMLGSTCKDKKIPNFIKEKVLKIIENEEKNKGYVDYITVSSWLCFSMNYCDSLEALKKETFYNCIRKNDYPEPHGYLEGLEVVTLDYVELFQKYQDKNVIFIIDPPYLQTEKSTYKNYWNLKDYLNVMDVLPGQNYIYFTSNKSSIIELCEWFETKTGSENPFKDAKIVKKAQPTTHNTSYIDIMLYKYKE